MFDEAPLPIDEGCLQQAKQAACASDVPLFNNLASASERLMPELDEVKAWLQSQPGVEGVLLCGSGSTTFAVVNGVNEACRLTAAAQARGWWARSTTFGSLRAAIVPLRLRQKRHVGIAGRGGRWYYRHHERMRRNAPAACLSARLQHCLLYTSHAPPR